MKNARTCVVLLNAALVLTGVGGAQKSQPASSTPPSASPRDAAPTTQQPQSSVRDEEPHTAPVFWVSSVEVLRSTHAPQLDVIRVRGLVTTEGWESAELVPLTKGVPADGFLDLALVAEAPTDSTAPTSYPAIEAVFAVEPGHPFKGVRVHGAANRVVLKTFPGYVEASAPPRDCVGCTGKYLLRRGEALPVNRTQENTIREEDLPGKLRVIRESDGIGTMDSDPNRLTLLLNEKGEIVLAIWD